MNRQDRSLTRKLAIALAIKLAVLTGLWWGFVREQRVPVDTDAAAMQLLGSRPAPTASQE
ncbi:MAG: cytochrome oxidase putative small subunit CydP [Hydrogenophaga sp.]|uniref:cytochrome oxidase putative small subunit CydP n=1 Tax=Hydrogenophaga sp. TaxID=1904254 RepID=UPI003D9B1089